MAQLARIFIGDDSDATLYYEVWYRIAGSTTYTQQTDSSPLPIYTTVSPSTSSAYIKLSPLADDTEYEYQVRRFDNDNNFSPWFSDTFTTGTSS